MIADMFVHTAHFNSGILKLHLDKKNPELNNYLHV